jgi:hypothetical protein
MSDKEMANRAKIGSCVSTTVSSLRALYQRMETSDVIQENIKFSRRLLQCVRVHVRKI